MLLARFVSSLHNLAKCYLHTRGFILIWGIDKPPERTIIRLQGIECLNNRITWLRGSEMGANKGALVTARNKTVVGALFGFGLNRKFR